VLRVKPRKCQRKHFTPDIEYEYQFKTGGVDHSQMVTSSNILTLIDNWIDDGAQE